MIRENRFAIIIGINDYTQKPLNFCVNDAREVEKSLVQHSRYLEENIFTIVSHEGEPIKDITGKYYEAYRAIKKKFKAKEDSILFYFAGHGKHFDNQSQLKFHDSYITIAQIFKDISSLEPRVQFYVIDACESGGKVLARSSYDEQDDLIKDYIDKSSGILFLYACQTEEIAGEETDKKHGTMTYHFLNSLAKDELYDEDRILTPGRIQEYVSKQTCRDTYFSQIPVIENRISGYYPFAFLEKVISKTTNHEYQPIGQHSRSTISTDINYSLENRIQLQNKIGLMIKEKIEFLPLVETEIYEIAEYNDVSELPLSNRSELIDKIVEDSNKNNLDSIGDVFTTDRKRNNNYNPFSKLAGPLMNILGGQSAGVEPEYFYTYTIDTSNPYAASFFRLYKSNHIDRVSFCIGYFAYQSKWGIVMSCMYFMVDWDGEQDSVLESIRKVDIPLLLTTQSETIVQELSIDTLFANIVDSIQKWNQRRMKELSDFSAKVTI